MGIQKIILGPKSKLAEQDVGPSPPEFRAEVERVLAQVPKEYLATTAAAAGLIGCGCGRFAVPDRKASVAIDGVVHRYGLPCYREGESKQLGALPVVGAATPEPPPRPGRGNVLDDLVAVLRERSDFGLRKYGTRLESWNGRAAHLDALQELGDLFVYLHQAEMERADLELENAALRAKVSAACCGKGGCSK